VTNKLFSPLPANDMELIHTVVTFLAQHHFFSKLFCARLKCSNVCSNCMRLSCLNAYTDDPASMLKDLLDLDTEDTESDPNEEYSE